MNGRCGLNQVPSTFGHLVDRRTSRRAVTHTAGRSGRARACAPAGGAVGEPPRPPRAYATADSAACVPGPRERRTRPWPPVKLSSSSTSRALTGQICDSATRFSRCAAWRSPSASRIWCDRFGRRGSFRWLPERARCLPQPHEQHRDPKGRHPSRFSPCSAHGPHAACCGA